MSDAIKVLEQDATHAGVAEPVLASLYDGTLDVLIIHNAFDQTATDRIASHFGNEDATENWNRPNRPVPGIDLRLLGVGAAPTATTPKGPSAEDYFAAAAATPTEINALFDEDFDPFDQIDSHLEQFAGRPVKTPIASNGSAFSPCTVRLIPEGESLMIHHDNHYGLPIYEHLLPQLDDSLLLSFFVVLQRPDEGGRLCLYDVGPEVDGELARLENGMLDPVAFHESIAHQYFDLAAGDMFIFASSRLYHTVEKVVGPKPRITIGGFMAQDAANEALLYWS